MAGGQFKNGDGDFLWQDGLEVGARTTLLGYPVEEDENMPDIGADAYPIAFDNFRSGHLIVDRTGISLMNIPLHRDDPHRFIRKCTNAANISQDIGG